MTLNRTKIGWTDRSWNPVTGCKAACPYCYAAALARGRMADQFPQGFHVPQFHQDRLAAPDTPKKPLRIFVCSMADLFGDWVPANWIADVLDVVDRNHRHQFQFLTKNPGRYADFEFPPNAWLGATTTTQEDYHLASGPLALARGGGPRFVSVEPILGPVRIGTWEPDWVIMGPMTGADKTHPPPGALAALAGQCAERKIPIYQKRACGFSHPRRQFPEVTP